MFNRLRDARNLATGRRNEVKHRRSNSDPLGLTPMDYVNRSKEGQNQTKADL
jgi:hypothetical protein